MHERRREERPRFRKTDAARSAAFRALQRVTLDDAYANLAIHDELDRARLERRDAAFATELVNGTCRGLGTYDRIIEAAGGRALADMDAELVDILRLATHQTLSMRVPAHAAVAASVDLAALTVGEYSTGIVNAITRKVTAKSYDEWIDELCPTEGLERTALATSHPEWIVEAYRTVLPEEELHEALAANNVPAVPTLVVRPGLCEVEELGEPTRWSPYGATSTEIPGSVAAIRERRAGVQDEGSQVVTQLLAEIDAPAGPWLDMCAGPGGKTALLWGLADVSGELLLASELHHHRAKLVAQSCEGYEVPPAIVCGDARRGPWALASFSKVLLDAPCSGLGSLRRRPESRWRKAPEDVTDLVPLQRELLLRAIGATAPGGVVAYVTCSPHWSETADVVTHAVARLDSVSLIDATEMVAHIPGASAGPFVQLWPHRHDTDAMFAAFLRVG